MKKFLLAFVASILMVSAANATQDPNQCPTVSAVASLGLNQISRDSSGILVYRDSNSYGTNSDWFFGLGLLSSKMTDKQALDKANSSLDQMNLIYGPFYSDIGGWFCIYTNSTDTLFGLARTIPFATISEFKSFIQKK